jgi:hypothetical protein
MASIPPALVFRLRSVIFSGMAEGPTTLPKRSSVLVLPWIAAMSRDARRCKPFAHEGDQRAVAWLIAQGADVNARSSSGRTAVVYAAKRNTGPKTLALLVAGRADLTARDADGRTALEMAKLKGKPRVVEWIARQLIAKRR